MRVLVVEDDEAIADVLRRSLRAEGHEVKSAGDGAEALSAAEDAEDAAEADAAWSEPGDSIPLADLEAEFTR